MATKDFKGFKTEEDTYNCYDSEAREALEGLGTAATKNFTTTITSDSTDLPTGGAVKDLVGWGNKNRLNDDDYVSDAFIDASSNIIGSATGAGVFYAYLEPNTTYTLSVNNGDRLIVASLNKIPVIGDSVKRVINASPFENVFTFTTGSDESLIGFYVNRYESSKPTQIQVEKGSTATAYEHYHPSVEEYIPQVVSDAVGWDGDNQFKVPYNQSSVSGDVSITVNDDGSITLGSGTTSTVERLVIRTVSDAYKPPKGLYKASKGFSNTNIGLVLEAYNGSTWVKAFPMSYSVDEQTFNIDYNGYDRIVASITISANTTVTGMTFTPKLMHLTVYEQKADNSVIAPIENGTNASQAWSIGQHFINDGVLKEVTSVIANGDAINSGNSKDVTVADAININTIANNTNLNDIKTTGTYVANNLSGLINNPQSINIFSMRVLKFSNIVHQILYSITSTNGSIYMRRYNGSSWSNWYKIDGTIVS